MPEESKKDAAAAEERAPHPRARRQREILGGVTLSKTQQLIVKIICALVMMGCVTGALALWLYTMRGKERLKNRVFVFSVELDLRSDLEGGSLSDAFRQEFQTHDISLSPRITIACEQVGKRWWITDDVAHKAYAVVRTEKALDVYRIARVKRVDPHKEALRIAAEAGSLMALGLDVGQAGDPKQAVERLEKAKAKMDEALTMMDEVMDKYRDPETLEIHKDYRYIEAEKQQMMIVFGGINEQLFRFQMQVMREESGGG